MPTKPESEPRRRLPNKNVEGRIHFNLDLSSDACVVYGVPSHLSLIPRQMQRNETKVGYNFQWAQTIPFEKFVATGTQAAESKYGNPSPWFRTRQVVALVACIAVTLLATVALAVAIASLQATTPALPPSLPHQSQPPARSHSLLFVLSPPASPPGPLTVATEFVLFDVVGVPVTQTLVSVDDILKQAVVDLLPHFVKERDVTMTRNSTNPATVHTSVNCGTQSNSALIVRNAVSQPSSVQGLIQETGFSGMRIENIVIDEVDRLEEPTAPKSPYLPPASPPYTPPPPPHLLNVSVYDETRCFDLKADKMWQGAVIAVEGVLVNTALEECAQQENCKVVCRMSRMDPWLLSNRQGFLVNEGGATTYIYRDGCEASPPAPPSPVLPPPSPSPGTPPKPPPPPSVPPPSPCLPPPSPAPSNPQGAPPTRPPPPSPSVPPPSHATPPPSPPVTVQATHGSAPPTTPPPDLHYRHPNTTAPTGRTKLPSRS